MGEFLDLDKLLPLPVVLRHDPFLRIPVANVILPAELVHHLPAFDAQTGFERVFSVVEAGVNDLRVPAARLRSHRPMLLYEKGGSSISLSELPSDG